MPPATSSAREASGSAAAMPSSPAAIQRGRYRQVIAKGDVEDLAALEAEVAAAE
ncbi:hypothetical protein [Bradyrhizobium elkanii]|uniref:hypothetical protein n=1 Tax=Bradyrhizobium elkanii TaxID=29448 RepID=UPI00384EFD09